MILETVNFTSHCLKRRRLEIASQAAAAFAKLGTSIIQLPVLPALNPLEIC